MLVYFDIIKFEGQGHIQSSRLQDEQVAQLSLTNLHYALHHSKQQYLKTVT